MFKRYVILENPEVSEQKSFLQRLTASLILYAYVVHCVVAPAYASADVMHPPRELIYYLPKDYEPLNKTLVQRQFRLWQSLPTLKERNLSFDPEYRPQGWSDRYQVFLGFQEAETQSIFYLPPDKNFVNKAGAEWLKNIYGTRGWYCQLADNGRSLSLTYKPSGIETISFVLNGDGNVRLTSLNSKKAVLYTHGALSLAFDEDREITPTLIVGAPIVRNETHLTTDRLHIFAQVHVNYGGYTLKNVSISAAHTINQSLCRAKDQLNFLAHKILDNENSTLQGDSLNIDAQHVKNPLGKILGYKRVRLKAQALSNAKGLIRSPEGLDLREVNQAELGGIETSGNLLLREGHFTMTSETAIGSADIAVNNRIGELIIEPDAMVQTPLKLIGTIKATSYHAHKSTVLGENMMIDEVCTERGTQLTFTPGQIKRFKTYMQDHSLTADVINGLESLEWLITSETEVLPYDIRMGGKLIIRAAPSAVIPKWLITKHAHASHGLEVYLQDSDIVMGDAQGVIYPEWIADTGLLKIHGKTFDQKSGLIAAQAGGSIETQGKVKIGEACENKTQYFSGWGVTGEFYTISDQSAVVYSGAPLLIKSSTEDIETVFAHFDARDLSLRTPKNILVLSSLLEGDGIWNIDAQHMLVSPDNKYINIPQSNNGQYTTHYDTSYIQLTPAKTNGNYLDQLWWHLAKDYSKLCVEGIVRLNLPGGYHFAGASGYIKGQIEYIHPIPASLCKLERIEVQKCTSYNQMKVGGRTKLTSSEIYTPADLSSGTSITLPARVFTMDGALMRAPIIKIRTTDGRVAVNGEAALQKRAEPKTLYDLQEVIRTGALTRINPDPHGFCVMPRFIRNSAEQLLPPAVFFIPGEGLSLNPPVGTRLLFDPLLEAKAIPDALFKMGYGQGYLYPRIGSKETYARMRISTYALYLQLLKDAPELIVNADTPHFSLMESKQEVALNRELLTHIRKRFSHDLLNKPMIIYGTQGQPILYVPQSFAHRSLQTSFTGILGDERATIAGLGDEPSQFLLTGTIDGGKITELLSDYTTVKRPVHTKTRQHTGKSSSKTATETITETIIGHGGLVRGDKASIDGLGQDFSGELDATDEYLLRGKEYVNIGVTEQIRQVSSASTKRGALGGKSVQHSSHLSINILPAKLGVRNDQGKGVISSDKTVDMTCPHFAAPDTMVQAPWIALKLGHTINSSSKSSSSTNPFINIIRRETKHHDTAVAPVMDGSVRFDTTTATIEYPVGVAYPKLTINLEAVIEEVAVADVHEETSTEHIAPGVATLGAVGLVGSALGSMAFTGTLGQMGVQVKTLDFIGKMAFSMAKAASAFLGSSVLQGMASGRMSINSRGLGVAIATAGLIGSSPMLSAEATFTENIAGQVAHAVATAPIQAAIHTTIGGETIDAALQSTLRQGVGHAIGSSLAYQIGLLYQGDDKIDYVSHKFAHFLAGSATGAIMDDDPLGGGLGAAFAEVTMEAMSDAQKEAQNLFKEHPHLSIAEVQEQLHDRLLAKRVFSQVIGGFVGALGGRNFHVASNTAAIALDYNMLPTLTDAATRAYVAQQALPALAIFLTTPQGMAVAAALGVAYWSKDKIIDFIKDDIGLLIKVYEMSMQAMAHAMDADMGAGKPKVNSTPIHQQNDQTLTTPMPEQQPILPGYEADPRATIADIEEFSVYNGPDMRVLEQRKFNCPKAESPIWQNAKPFKGQYKQNADGSEIYKWDHMHNEIEVFHPKTGMHLGVRDPITGDKIRDAKPERYEKGVK